MFIRIKTINGSPYAYLVSNTWRKRAGSTKQRIKKYLGRVVKFGKKSPSDLILHGNSASMIQDIVHATLSAHGFTRTGKKLEKDDILIDFTSRTITRKGKPIVLGLDKGYFCTYTLRRLYRFRIDPDKDVVEHEGVRFATYIVDAGLSLPQEGFVTLFEQFWKEQFPKSD